MERIFKLISSVAPTISTVLITGDSGTGKELVARAIHYNSPRRDKPFVIVDCGALPGNLIESELFGYKKGAFTGAQSDKKGLLETAEGGTLFLDEIGNLPLDLQSKILRVLQEKEFRPIGGKRSRQVDIRFITATNKNLYNMVQEGTFRDDLFYRLNIFPIHVPPLRERKEDIPPLAYHFLKKYSVEMEKQVSTIPVESMRVLLSYQWPGNVRELENTIQRALLLTENSAIKPEDLSSLKIIEREDIPQTVQELKGIKKHLRERSVEEIERSFVVEALKRNKWNVTLAAREVGMQRPNFHAMMKKHSIRKTI
jgi:transcriptional regulator with PAS, ATPase and Fis domain